MAPAGIGPGGIGRGGIGRSTSEGAGNRHIGDIGGAWGEAAWGEYPFVEVVFDESISLPVEPGLAVASQLDPTGEITLPVSVAVNAARQLVAAESVTLS